MGLKRKYFADTETSRFGDLLIKHQWPASVVDGASHDTVRTTGYVGDEPVPGSWRDHLEDLRNVREAFRGNKIIGGPGPGNVDKDFFRRDTPDVYSGETVLGLLKALDRADWDDDDYDKLVAANLLQYLRDVVSEAQSVLNTRLQIEPSKKAYRDSATAKIAKMLATNVAEIVCIDTGSRRHNSFMWSPRSVSLFEKEGVNFHNHFHEAPVLTASALWQLRIHPYLLDTKYLVGDPNYVDKPTYDENWLVAAGTRFLKMGSDEESFLAIKFTPEGPSYQAVALSQLRASRYVILTHS